MPKKTKKKPERSKRILAFLDDIDWMFQLNNWDKSVILKERDEDGKAAEILTDESYQHVTVSVYPCFFEHKLEEQRKFLLHELIHTILAKQKLQAYHLLDGRLVTKDALNEANERATSQLENILDRLLTGRLSYAKKAYEKYLK